MKIDEEKNTHSCGESTWRFRFDAVEEKKKLVKHLRMKKTNRNSKQSFTIDVVI